jgi:ribose transport system substrate-binding protein
MKKFSVLLLVVMVTTAMLSACAPAATPPPAPTQAPQVIEKVVTQVVEVEKPQELKDVTIGFSWNRQDSALLKAWQDYMQAYGNEAGPKNGFNIKWVFNVADGDVARQASNVQDLINQNVNLIGARAEDAAAIGASAKAAADAGIPFITFDRESSGYEPTAHAGADSLTQAITTARAFAEILKKNNVQNPQCIEVLGDLKDMNAVYRSQGWQQVEKEMGAWKTIVQVPTEWNADKFYTGVANALQAHPEANCMFVASDYAFQGVEKALQEAGKLAPTGDPNHMWMAAQDVNPPGLAALEKGYIDVVTSYDAYFHSVAFVDAAIKLLKGEELGVKKYLVPGRVVTQENYKDMPNLWARDYAGQ